MKKNTKIAIGVVAVLAMVACIGGGKIVLDRAAAAGEGGPEPQTTVAVQTSGVPDAEKGRFAVPTPIPTGVQGSSTEPKNNGEATVTEDEDGTVTIVPNWEAKAQYAHPVEAAPDPNIGGSGGEKLEMEDGVYRGEHPGEETPDSTPKPTPVPTPTPVATPTPEPVQPPDSDDSKEPTITSQPQEPDEQTPPPTPTPSQPSGGGALPPSYDGSYDGELSPDGKYGWFKGFGWVERGEGSYGIPSKGTNTELSGEKVGEM